MAMPPHTRMILAAAREVLRPLGCVQKGRSRTWLDDRTWWVGVIEFQPSGWSKGSYLNVGACWLWVEKDFLSFDAGYRVEAFQEYEDDEQFAGAARLLAERAGQEVKEQRARFESPAQASAYMETQLIGSVWGHYHLAIAAGLAGATESSKHSFANVMASRGDQTWVKEVKRRAAELLRCLELGNGFKTEVADSVARTRALLGLPVLSDIVFD